jgi:hypothetical protein
MRRRQYLVALGIVTSGCLGSSAEDSPTDVSLSAEDSNPAVPDVSLNVSYNNTVDTEIPTEPTTVAEDGQKWLLVRMDVTNTGTDARDLNAYQYRVVTDADQYEQVITKESWELRGKEATPDETVSGWVVFHIPESVTDATLTVGGGQRNYAVAFTHDTSLDADPPT